MANYRVCFEGEKVKNCIPESDLAKDETSNWAILGNSIGRVERPWSNEFVITSANSDRQKSTKSKNILRTQNGSDKR
jgi:hypothetical protein